MSFGILHLGPAIAEYLQQYPDVVIDLDLNDRVVDLVEDGYDVAVRIGPLQDSSLVARPLAPQRLLVCASPDYLRRHGTPATPEDLKLHRCLHYAYASTGNEWHFEKDGQVRLLRVNAALRANNGDVLRTAALAGHGVILQPEFLVGEDVRAGRLTEILTDYTNTSIAMYAVYPHRRFLSPKVRSFVEHLEARFAAPARCPPPAQRSAAAGRILSMTAKSPIEYFPAPRRARFCSQCGSPVNRRVPEGDNRERDICDHCGAIHYQNPGWWSARFRSGKTACCCAGARSSRATTPGRCRRASWNWAKAPRRARRAKRWKNPAPASNWARSTPSSTCRRSSKCMCYLAQALGPELDPGPESLEARYYDEAEIPWDDLAFRTVSSTLRRYFEDRKHGAFGPHHYTLESHR